MQFILRSLLTCSALVIATGCDIDDNNGNGNNGNGNGELDDEGDESDLTDGEIADVLRTVNLGEIAQANTVLPRLTTETARDYADEMVEEHTDRNRDLDELVASRALDFEESALSRDLQADSDRIVAELQDASVQDIDQLYLQNQIDAHDDVLRVILDELLPDVVDDELEEFLENTRDAVGTHRDEADAALEQVLGVDP